VSKSKRSTISNDPYAFIGTPNPPQGRSRPQESQAPEPPPPATKPVMEKITTPYPVELIERARNAAYWDRTTLAGIMVQALADALDRMEQGRGEPYPPRQSELRGGRPVGTGKSK
jgi:ribosome-binding protein aMBF1 (putative translation factor)